LLSYNGFNSNLCEKATLTVSDSKTWLCLICGWLYEEKLGLPEEGIPAGTPWGQVPMNWTCPECGARKEDFEMVEI
jgi:rubredoxin